MYNEKTRQAEGGPKGVSRPPDSRPEAAEEALYVDDARSEQHSWPVHYSGSGTGSLPPKQNSAFGHARTEDVRRDFLRRAA